MSDSNKNRPSELDDLRQRLDAIDDNIIDLAAERQSIVTAISESKL